MWGLAAGEGPDEKRWGVTLTKNLAALRRSARNGRLRWSAGAGELEHSGEGRNVRIEAQASVARLAACGALGAETKPRGRRLLQMD